MLETILTWQTALSFLGGAVVSATLVYKYVASHITVEEAQTIYAKLKIIETDYLAAKAKGALTTEDKLKLAEDAIAAMQEIVKDLEQ